MAVSNTDDHLRNHGFLLTRNGWRLSPLYDVNPVEEGDELALNVSETDNRISIALALETAHYYGIKKQDAERMASEILVTVRDNWERVAKQCSLNRSDIEDKRPAFGVCYEI
jgi:serine/threonine-protein kinase HipA